jgi:hypothetical protein
MTGNILFLVGAALETVGLHYGVSVRAVAWSLLIYGAVLLWTGYTK